MKPENILKADILDILFENRNKDYGAYELRTHYPDRLKKSLMIIFLLISVLILINYWIGSFTKKTLIPILPPDVQLTDVDLSHREIPKLRAQPVSARRRPATIMNVVPLIVKTNVEVNPPPTIHQLTQSEIGTTASPGDEGETGTQQAGTSGAGNAQEIVKTEEEKETILESSEVMPEFPGGLAGLQRFLHKNLRMPKDDMEAGVSSHVKVRFVVDKDGSVTGISLMQSGGELFDAEVMRVVKKMPHWKPGMQHGNNVAVYYYLPVIFEVPQENP